MSFDLILPFLRPVQELILDNEISEILVNATGRVFVERAGLLEFMPESVTIPERQRQAAVRNIARLLGDDISEEMPLLDARLPDGSRVAAVMPPASVGGTVIAIRKFRSKVFTADELVRRGMLSGEMLGQLRAAIEARRTILISGGTGTGKTTLLNALSAFIPEGDRIVIIEDTAEIDLTAPNLVRLEARRAQPDQAAITIRDLLRQTLRLRPDRIILGEVRGAEAFDLLQALNTGHSGTISTIHANSARLAVSRLRTCVAMAGIELPERAVARSIADVVHVLVHIERRAGNRFVSEIVEIDRFDSGRDQYEFRVWDRKEAPHADFDAPGRYLRENFDREDRLAVVLIHRGTQRVEQKLATAEHIASPKYQAHPRAANANGSDVFISMNTIRAEATGRTKADVDVIRHLYLDVDAGGREAVDRILNDARMPNPHHVLETSPGKHQMIWQVDGFDRAEAEAMLRNLAAAHGGDPAATDCSRVLRLPGFRNCKYEQPHYVRDVHDTPAGEAYGRGDFPWYTIDPPAVSRAVKPHVNAAAGKSQSERDYAYALRRLERGDNPAVIECAIADFRRADKRNPDDYARRTVMNARMKLAGREAVVVGDTRDAGGLER